MCLITPGLALPSFNVEVLRNLPNEVVVVQFFADLPARHLCHYGLRLWMRHQPYRRASRLARRQRLVVQAIRCELVLLSLSLLPPAPTALSVSVSDSLIL